MTRKEAADILGIQPNDDLSSVKKAYRKLAMRYHPDHNPDEEAKAMFIMVHDAYTYLCDVAAGKIDESRATQTRKNRSSYGPNWQRDHRAYTEQTYTKEEFEKRYQEARQKAEDLFEKKSNAIYAQSLRQYQSSWRKTFVKYFAPFAAILGLLLSIDYFLPTQTEVRTDTYVYYDENGWGSTHFLQYGMRHCDISKRAFGIMYDRSLVATIHRKPILRHAQQFDIVTDHGVLLNIVPSYRIHRFFPVIHFLLFLPLASLFIERARFWFVFTVVYSNLYVVPGLFLIILYRMLT